MHKLDEIIEDCEIIFDNPDARVPLSLVSREDLYMLMRAVIQECQDICEVHGDGGWDGHYCSDAIHERFKE